MCCLTCAYYDPIEPDAHRVAREAGRCEAHCGQSWTWYTAFRYVGSKDPLHAEPLRGICRLNPSDVSKLPWSVCGQHEPVLRGDNGWGVRAYRSSDRDHGIVEWAHAQYLTIKRGTEKDRARAELEAQNQELRRQLASARKRSASRLAKLQKGAKPKPAKPEPVEVPAVAAAPELRLVVNG